MDKRTILKEWLQSGQASLQPLTFPQRELWEASPVPVGDTANHICSLIHVRGTFTLASAEKALRRVVERQEALRLSFLPGKTQPLQMIRREGEAVVPYRELKPSECSDDAVDEIAAENFLRPFDLLQGPLYRTLLLRRSAEDHVLLFTIHHAVSDGWTLGVFIEDFCLAYVQELLGLREPLPALGLTYSGWGAAERAYWTPAELEKRLAFWRPELAGTSRMWDAREGAGTAAGPASRWVQYFSKETAEAAQELARTAGATLFSTLLTAYQVALYQWTGNADIPIGAPVANRPTQNVREIMGSFSSIVPIRARIDPAASFASNLRAVHQRTLDSTANAMPFAELAAALGEVSTPGHQPVYEVRFALQNHPVPDVTLQGLSAKLTMKSSGTSRFHLACEITIVPAGLLVAWLFRPEIFPPEEIANLHRLYAAALATACRAPDTRVSQFAS